MNEASTQTIKIINPSKEALQLLIAETVFHILGEPFLVTGLNLFYERIGDLEVPCIVLKIKQDMREVTHSD